MTPCIKWPSNKMRIKVYMACVVWSLLGADAAAAGNAAAGDAAAGNAAAAAAAGNAATAAAAAGDACRQVRRQYEHRYELDIEAGSSHRPLRVDGAPAALDVWGAARGPAVAAAALLHAALRHVLRYPARLRRRRFDLCALPPHFSHTPQLDVAPVAYSTDRCHRDLLSMLDEMELGDGAGAVSAGWPLRAHAAGGCDARPRRLRLRDCAFLTLSDLKAMLPFCGIEEMNGSSAAVVFAGAEDTSEIDEVHLLQKYFHEHNLSYAIVILHDSCFHQTLQDLRNRNASFLYFDRDLKTFDKDSVRVYLDDPQDSDTCPDGLNIFRTLRIGNGLKMDKYAPQIANVVTKFCPRSLDLKNILSKELKHEDMENVACEWILQNTDTIESWITTPKKTFLLHVILCADDPLNVDYTEIIKVVIKKNMEKINHFSTSELIETVDCTKHSGVHGALSAYNNTMGTIAWSSSEGIPASVHTANINNDSPLVLAGPITSETHPGTAATAINGELADLAYAYRNFLSNCKWSRLAILSDGSSYAKAFTVALLEEGGIVQKEKTVELKTIADTLSSLKSDDARIFIVNTNSSMAVEILQSAMQSEMTPNEGYAWIVREWSLTREHIEISWGAMEHYSIETEWRGEVGGKAGGEAAAAAAGGDTELRRRLAELWPDAPWPAHAAPLADAISVLIHSFAVFHRLYSSNAYGLRAGKYAKNFSQIYDVVNVTGVAKDLKFYNGSFKSSLVFLHKWHGYERTLLAHWRVRDRAFDERNMTLCGTPRIPDRPWCWIAGGGSDFVKRCYDSVLYVLVGVFIIFLFTFFVVRRVRLKYLEERDRKLLDSLLGTNRSPSIVNKVSLHRHKVIGTGNFGRVYLATLQQLRNKSVEVAAKELWNDRDKERYIEEARILALLDHKNIIKFVGVCAENGSLLILMKYASYGDLLKYLKERRHLVERKRINVEAKDELESKHVSAEALTRLAGEAAAALEYLAGEALVHRDVRAANCLVDEHRTLKLADFGMARKLDGDHEYTTFRQALFPVLWMAPESLSHGTFSLASDVWALGVLLLEIATLGGRPYGDWAPQRVLTYVRLGGHPPLPPDTSSQTRSVVAACWHREAEARPDAAEVARFLRREPRALRPALLPPSPPAAPAAPAAPPPPHRSLPAMPATKQHSGNENYRGVN